MNSHRLAPLVILLAAAAGCTQQAKIEGDARGGPGAKAADPWPAAVVDLRKQTDPATCRRVLNQLNADLTGNPAVAPAAPSADEVKRLTATLRLDDDEVREVTATSYSGIDATYLADALYLRDAARSLDTHGFPPDAAAAAGFAWVCRQVYLRPWVLTDPDGQKVAPPLPPTVVLRRGYGTGLERAYVFLALLQQLGLDGCLVGPPGREQAVTRTVVDGKLGKGPFWAVGVRAGDDVLLFDPYRGEPVPGPGGKGVGTLGQLKKTPDQVKAWRDDKANPWDVSPAEITDAVVYLAVPLSAVSPRMKVLDARLATGVGVKLAADPKDLADRFAKGPAPVAVWAPPAATEPFSYTRVQAYFLPKAEGGLSRTDHRLAERLEQDRIPKTLGVHPPGLDHPEALLMMIREPFQVYAATILAPGHREKIQRGQFNDASQGLIAADQVFAAIEQRSRDDIAKADAIRAWVERARDVYKRLSRASLPENRATDLPVAQAEVAEFWKTEGRGAQMLTDQAVAAAGRSETSYLLAVCKHEQAERAELRLARAAAAVGAAKGSREKAEAEKARDRAATAAADAWGAAKDAWERYAPYADRQAAAVPGRAEQTRQLAARAAQLAANPAAGL